MAVNGAWGSGKTTLLNFVKHELRSMPSKDKPVVIEFNPWWFEGHQLLASQFLAQFSSNLPQEWRAVRGIRDVIAKYADSLGSVVATASGHVWLKFPTSFIAKLFGHKVKDVPALKEQIAKTLKENGERFVFIVDDIDRLDTEQIREVFKVLKALANFPNVIYLLAFDRQTVAGALSAALKMDGEAYLEKIVQAPFTLPAIDRTRLRKKLYEEVDRILAACPSSPGDAKYWSNVYFDGLDPYIRKPRDIVRLINAISFTYPSVAGEVNYVDFIALEFMRIFEPGLYATIRDNPKFFTGLRSDWHRGQADPERIFHDTWLHQIAEERQSSVKALAKRLFPRLDSVWGNTGYSDEHHSIWRKLLRACSPEAFDAYFRFGVLDEALRRREVNELLANTTSVRNVSEILVNAAKVVQPNGISKAREYIDRLLDLKEEVTPVAAQVLLTAIFDIGDTLFNRIEEPTDFFPNRWRLIVLSNHLLKRVATVDRFRVIEELVRRARARTLALSLVDSIEKWKSKAEETPDAPLAQVSDEELGHLKDIVVQSMRELPDADLARLPELDLVTHRWRQWDDSRYVAARMGAIFGSDEYLPLVLEGFLRFGSTQSVNDNVATRTARMDPRVFEKFTDINELEPRVVRMLERPELTANQREAGEQFVEALHRIRRGVDPGGLFADTED
jgi:predicted KAP-like P-loop ATPase